MPLTEGSRAEQLFTNRWRELRLFLDALHRPPWNGILFFHADGGNGKSLLLRVLAKRYCRLIAPADWVALQESNDRTVVETVASAANAEAVPHASLDFGMPARGDDRPQEAFSALVMLRRRLTGSGLRFHVFDLALVLFLRRTQRLSAERLRDFVPNEELGLATAVFDALAKTTVGSIASAILGLFEKHTARAFTVWSHERKVTKEVLDELLQMDPERELIAALPDILAADVNASMRADGPRRLVLFFDAHDAFWREQRRGLSTDLFFQRDEWLRRFVRGIEGNAGTVLVAAGREIPLWPEAKRFPVPAERLQAHEVGLLGTGDADQYLLRAGVQDEAMRSEVLRISTVASGAHHPLTMGFFADALDEAKGMRQPMTVDDLRTAAGGHIGGQAVAQLLRYAGGDLEYAARALAACRAFDRSLYYLLGDTLRFLATAADYRLLTSLSFVWRSTNEQYRIHDLVRKLLHESADPILLEAHAALEQHYRRVGDRAEAAYHANRVDRARGARLWLDELDGALEGSNFAAAATLLQLAADIELEGPYERGRFTRLAADYEAAYGRTDAARRLHTAALRLLRDWKDDTAIGIERAITLSKAGEVADHLADYRRASLLYRRAVQTIDAVLSVVANSALAWSSRAYALLGTAEVKMWQSAYGEARAMFAEASRAADEALRLRPDWPEAVTNKGHALSSEAEAAKKLGDAAGAVEALRAGVAMLRRATQSEEMTGTATANLIWATAELADALTAAGSEDDVEQVYLEARAVIDAALARWPESVYVAINSAYALNGYGDWLQDQDEDDTAREQFARAYAVARDILQYAPMDVRALSAASYSMLSLGVLELREEHYGDARTNLEEAIAIASRGLAIAPAEPVHLTNRGAAYRYLAEAMEGLRDAAAAADAAHAALADLRRATAGATADPDPALELSRAAEMLARLEAECGREDEADALYAEAARVADLFAAVNVDLAHLAATSRIARAQLAAERTLFEDALAWLDEAARVLDPANDDEDLRKAAVDALLAAGRVLWTMRRYDDARRRLEKALDAVARDGMPSRAYHEALLYLEIGHVETQRKRHADASAALRAALNAIRESDGDKDDQIEEARIHFRLSELSATTGDLPGLRRNAVAARAICEGLLANEPQSVPALSMLAATAALEGEHASAAGDIPRAEIRFREAISVSERALRHTPFDRNLLWQKLDASIRLAAICGDTTLLDESERDLRQLLARAPHNPAVCDSIQFAERVRAEPTGRPSAP